MTSDAGNAAPVPSDAPAPARSSNRAPGKGADGPGEAAPETADAVEVLGLVAALEHQAFARLAADSAEAPDLEQSLALSRFAARCGERRDRVLARITELGGDPVAALGRFDRVLEDFDTRTPPSSWSERLLKAYVGYGVADDFCRLVARGLDPRSRELVAEVLGDASHAELAVRELDAACAQDTVLSARLALWGRRLVGEALGVVQRLVQRPGVARVLDRAEVAAPEQETPATVFNELTAEHTRRMSRLHLTA
ncbi:MULTISPECIES: ferritin-like fold-containing protein [Cellulomonas]|uniref:ferritin-like fold-containing protein n=1 Tax=Cellulomonas TaxID=1707 RepID=UPI0010A86B07|nr:MULTISPECIES: ferritin-like fold-containing protein [Cellulomonas]